MTKVLKQFLCCAMIAIICVTLFAFVASAQATPKLTVVSTNGELAGQEVDINIKAENFESVFSNMLVVDLDGLSVISVLKDGIALNNEEDYFVTEGQLRYVGVGGIGENNQVQPDLSNKSNALTIKVKIPFAPKASYALKFVMSADEEYSCEFVDKGSNDIEVALVNGTIGINLTKSGWHQAGGKWYFYESGKMVISDWRKDRVGWVFLGSDGAMKTNDWVRDSVGWCYVGADGYAVTNCWKKDSVGWCYLNAEGSMTKSKWVKDGGKWYYLNANGYMEANKWMKDSVGWVFLGSDGAMKTNSWVRDSVGWCYVGADGYAVTNCWKKDSVGWCYLNAEGSMTKNKWVKDGGKWYYLNASGYMVANKSMTIGGKKYNFNASGVCTNP